MIYKAKQKQIYEVCQWTGFNQKEIQDFIDNIPHYYNDVILIGSPYDCGCVYPGDYIIKDNYNIYVRQKDWFEQDYEIIAPIV